MNRGRQADGDCGDQPQRHAAAAGDQSTLAGPKGELACNAGEEDRQQKDEQVPGAHGLAAVPGGDAEPDDRQHDAHTGEPVRRPDEVLAHAPEVHEGVSRELDRVVEVDEGIPGGAEPILNNPEVVGVVLRGEEGDAGRLLHGDRHQAQREVESGVEDDDHARDGNSDQPEAAPEGQHGRRADPGEAGPPAPPDLGETGDDQRQGEHDQDVDRVCLDPPGIDRIGRGHRERRPQEDAD